MEGPSLPQRQQTSSAEMEADKSLCHRETTPQLPPDVRIKIGDKEYDVGTQKIPYFRAWLDFNLHLGNFAANEMPVHGGLIPFFDIIHYAVNHGFHHLFRLMPSKLDDYKILCETLDYLCINPIQSWHMLRLATREAESKGPNGYGLDLMGDAAFRVLFKILMDDFESMDEDSTHAQAYVATIMLLGVQDHYPMQVSQNFRLFQERPQLDLETKRLIREAYDARFISTKRQQQRLDKLIETAEDFQRRLER